jgi:hypothetical protein
MTSISWTKMGNFLLNIYKLVTCYIVGTSSLNLNCALGGDFSGASNSDGPPNHGFQY